MKNQFKRELVFFPALKGKEGFLPNEFFQKNEKTIETQFRKNPGTKARMVLFCEMFSVDLKSGEETRKETAFYSKFHELLLEMIFQI